MSSRFQAPRGTDDVLPKVADRRAALEETARKILGRAGYGRIETPAFEATQLFSRTVGEATDVVQKEMYTFDDGGGNSVTLRPEGTAPVCRAYLEHGMHKEPQPVKLWYWSSFFRRERPQKGRYRQFWQAGVEAIGSDDPAVDAEVILLLAELLEAVGAREVRLILTSLGSPEARHEYREELKGYLRAHEDELSEDVRDRIDLDPANPLHRQHALRRVALDHAWHEQPGELGERAAEVGGVARLDPVIQLVGERALELLDDADHVDAASGFGMRGQEPGNLAEERHVVDEELPNAWPLDLDHDVSPVAQRGRVHLAEARRADRFLVEGGEQLADARAEFLLDRLLDVLEGDLSDVVLQAIELADEGLRK